MWRKHRSLFQHQLKYICNDILKPFRVGILRYAERVQEMHELEIYLHPHLMKADIFDSASWGIQNKQLSDNDIQVAIKDGFSSSMKDELEDN